MELEECLHVHSDTNKSTVTSSDDIMSKDQRLLRIILENHIMKNKVVLGQLYNGQHLETIGGKRLRVFIYRTVCPLRSSQFLPRNDDWCKDEKCIACRYARLHAFQQHRLIDFGLNWCFYDRLCALRTPVWSGAVKREAMEHFTSQKLCWNQQKNPCMKFWGRAEDLSMSTSILNYYKIVDI